MNLFKYIGIPLFWLFPLALFGQGLHVESGAQLNVSGNASIVVQDGSFLNDGNFSAGHGTVYLLGTAPVSQSVIGGTSSTSFYALTLHKSSNDARLENHIDVVKNLSLLGGKLDLNTYVLTLDPGSGQILGENETNRIIGPLGGKVVMTVPLTSPSGLNPGNIGLNISSPDNLGLTTIRRGHIPFTSVGGGQPGLDRYYEVIPGNSGATVDYQYHYFDPENSPSYPEADLELFVSTDDGASWWRVGKSAQDLDADWVRQNALNPAGSWTLSACPTINFSAIATGEDCPGAEDGSIEVTASAGGLGPYNYSHDNGNTWSSLPLFSGLAPGSYPVQVRDASGCLSAVVNYTVDPGVDNTPPTMICQPFTVMLELTGFASIQPSDIDNGSWDHCGMANLSVSPNTFSLANVGANTVVLTGTDVNGNVATCSTMVTVVERPAVLTYTGETEVQYSDVVNLSANLVDSITSQPIANDSVRFTIGSQSTWALTDANGDVSTTLTIDQPLTVLGYTYMVESYYLGNNSMHLPANDSDPFTIRQENARTTFTGTLFASTSSISSSQATVTLSATIQDISDVSADPDWDPDAGDISQATVRFIDRDNGFINATPLPVVLVDPNDPTVGTVFYSWTVDIQNLESESFTIGIVVDNYYTRNSTEEDVVITVSRPLDDFVTGGGYITLSNSAGYMAGDPGSKNNFGFNIKYTKKGNKLKGKINTIFRRTEPDGLHVYQIKGNVMSNLAVNPVDTTAVFTGKANVQDVTDPLNPISVLGNGEFQVNMTDNGNPGDMDSIAFSLFEKNGTLVFSSKWSGVQTEEEQLDGGNLVIHFGAGKAKSITISPLNQEEPLLKVYPNPSDADVNLEYRCFSCDGMVDIWIINQLGQIIWRKEKLLENGQLEMIIPAGFWPEGVYYLHLSQGSFEQTKPFTRK